MNKQEQAASVAVIGSTSEAYARKEEVERCIFSADFMRFILAQPSPDYWTPRPVPLVGACRYCGQTRRKRTLMNGRAALATVNRAAASPTSGRPAGVSMPYLPISRPTCAICSSRLPSSCKTRKSGQPRRPSTNTRSAKSTRTRKAFCSSREPTRLRGKNLYKVGENVQ